jgi:DHA1 family inner membrane transport protein
VVGRFLDESQPAEVKALIGPLTAARLCTNALYRMTPPLLAVVGRGLGVSLSTMGTALSLGELTGVASPAIGRRVDRVGHRTALSVGMLLLVVGGAGIAASPWVWTFALCLTLVAVAKTVFDAAMGGWIATHVDYRLRAQVVGITESSWAGAMLVGVPVLALVAAQAGWRAAYAVAALANLALWWVLRRRMRRDGLPAPARPTGRAPRPPWRVVLPVVAGFVCLMSSSQFVVVVFGAWLEDAFGYSTAGIGAVSFLLGFGELAATIAAVRFTDRFGKRRAVVLGAVMMVPSGVALAASGDSALLGIAAVAVFITSFEYALVSGLPLVTETHRAAPAWMLGMVFGGGTIGRATGSFVSTRLYSAHGMAASAGVAAALAAATIAVFLSVVREPGVRSEPA